jgi:DNA uptake protein ComE-like DNA-binding protein
MTRIDRVCHSTLGVVTALTMALAVMLALPASARAQAVKLLDANAASVEELAQLPGMSGEIAKGLVAARPFKTVVELNKFLLDAKLSPAQAKELYRKAFVLINLNTGTREQFLLIPGVGPRMAGEFEEYRPWKTWAQFDKEIGKYVGQQETDRLKQYVVIATD